MKRRDFLRNAGSAIVPAVLPAALWSAPSAESQDESQQAKARLVARELIPVTAVIYDQRYANCRAFAEALERGGAKAFATNEDAVQLWYGPLRAHLESNPGRIAGLATYADFSASVACGRELAYALRFEGHHDARSGSDLAHQLIAHPNSTGNSVAIANPQDIAEALTSGSWATQLAEALMRTPEPTPATHLSGHQKLTSGAASEATTFAAPTPSHPSYLSSWLLEPAASA